MITLRNKSTGEYIDLTYQEYDALPNLVDFEPIDANDMVEVFKSDGEGGIHTCMITDAETGERLLNEQPDLYADCDPFDTYSLKVDYACRTMTPEQYKDWVTSMIDRNNRRGEQ